jgi:hypothetical protein
LLTLSYSSADFGDKNVGTGKTVSVLGISISGVDAGNYTFNTTATTSANSSVVPTNAPSIPTTIRSAGSGTIRG